MVPGWLFLDATTAFKSGNGTGESGEGSQLLFLGSGGESSNSDSEAAVSSAQGCSALQGLLEGLPRETCLIRTPIPIPRGDTQDTHDFPEGCRSPAQPTLQPRTQARPSHINPRVLLTLKQPLRLWQAFLGSGHTHMSIFLTFLWQVCPGPSCAMSCILFFNFLECL